MKTRKQAIRLDASGVDAAAAVIETWLTEAGVKRSDLLRIRLTAEELLLKLCGHSAGESPEAELCFGRRLGSGRLTIRWDGARFDPTRQAESDMAAYSEDILSRTGIAPEWRRRGETNELRLRVPTSGLRPELLMLLCIAAAVLVGLLGRWLPESLRAGITDYSLRFLAGAFMNLLNTFMGLMVFLSIVTGICGIGSVAAFGRLGKLMLSRFIGFSFLISCVLVLACRFVFHLPAGASGGESAALSILELIFGILPTNPIKPFLEGNTLQIVFMGIMVGAALLVVGNEADGMRRAIGLLQKVVMKCVTFSCALLPIYIFSSLVIQFWDTARASFWSSGSPSSSPPPSPRPAWPATWRSSAGGCG